MTKTISLTKNQGLVLEILKNSQTPMGAYELLDKLRDVGFRAPLQVYRALDKLSELGLVHRLESLNSYMACCNPEEHGGEKKKQIVAFAICETCNQVIEFSSKELGQTVSCLGDEKAFAFTSAIVEIKGYCQSCHKA